MRVPVGACCLSMPCAPLLASSYDSHVHAPMLASTDGLTHTRTHTRTRTRTRTRTHAHIHARVRAHARTHARTRARAHTHAHTCMIRACTTNLNSLLSPLPHSLSLFNPPGPLSPPQPAQRCRPHSSKTGKRSTAIAMHPATHLPTPRSQHLPRLTPRRQP